MHSRTAYIRRSRKSQRLKQRLAAAAMLGVAACATLLFVTRDPAPPQLAANDVPRIAEVPAAAPAARAWQASAPAAAAPKTVRRVYPYSIVPGGVAGRDDVVRMMKMDKVVASHYASFQVDRASVTTVTKPRAVYVSYRKGDKVYWTAGKHTLAAGETLLTDGSNEIRGRCGNRVSDVAMLPVEAKGPSEAELDAGSDEAVDGDDGSAQNVSFTADSLADSGGQAFRLGNYYGAGLAGGSAAANARGGSSGIGLPGMPDLADMLRIANGGMLLATATQASGTGDTASGGASTPATPGASAPAQGDATGGSSGGAGDPGHAGSGGSGDTGGNAGGNSGGSSGDGSTPATGPVIPVPQTPPQKPDGGLPEVLQPTQPVTVPSKSEDGKDDSKEVPEPGTLWLAGAAFAALLVVRRKRRG
jgi:hypothetical protein